MGREATLAVSGARASVAEALRAHASVVCLQRPSLPTGRLNKLILQSFLPEDKKETNKTSYAQEVCRSFECHREEDPQNSEVPNEDSILLTTSARKLFGEVKDAG